MLVKFKDRYGIPHIASVEIDQTLVNLMRKTQGQSCGTLFLGGIKISSAYFSILYHKGFLAIPGTVRKDATSDFDEVEIIKTAIRIPPLPTLPYYDIFNHSNWVCHAIAEIWLTIDEKPAYVKLWAAMTEKQAKFGLRNRIKGRKEAIQRGLADISCSNNEQ